MSEKQQIALGKYYSTTSISFTKLNNISLLFEETITVTKQYNLVPAKAGK